jgi:hypothetical protein
VETKSATTSQAEEAKEETAMPEIVSSDVKVEILVHEELKTDNEKE